MSKETPVNQEKIKSPEVVVVPSEEIKKPEVELNLEPQQETPAPDPTEKLRNQMFYEMRQQEKKILAAQKQMLDDFVQRMSGNPQPQKVREQLDEFDEEVERVAQTDWRKAVDMRAEKKADELFEKKMKAQEDEKKSTEFRQNTLRIEARGRDKVITEFPDIVDESTPAFKAYMDIYNREVNEDPYFMNNPRKHDIILPELREKMKSKPIEMNPEIDRLKRVAAGSITPTRQNTESNKIMLTQEEITMCKRSGIPIETYARTKKLGLNALKEEGVVMDE